MEPGRGVNSRAITGCTIFRDMHTFTRESQDVMEGTVNTSITRNSPPSDEAVRNTIV